MSDACNPFGYTGHSPANTTMSAIRFILALLLLAACLPPLRAAEGDAEAPRPNSVFLVASRTLLDPNFRETVLLVTQHGGGGPVGVIINRPSRIPLARLFPDIEGLSGRPDKVLHGGPVGPRVLVFVFRAPSAPPNAIALLDGVYMSLDQSLLRELLKRDSPLEGLRVYAGYAGWAPGQLQAEIARGSWHLAAADAHSIFAADLDKLWDEQLRRATARRARAPGTPELLARSR